MAPGSVTIVSLVRAGRLDAELAALLWLLSAHGAPVHVVAPDLTAATTLATAIRSAAGERAVVTEGAGGAIEDVLRQPVPLRPATGAVVVLDRDGRVSAAHLHRPPLRDAAGHVRPQGPAVLATWDATAGHWEHFAWGVAPDLAAATGQRPGDVEIEQRRRREYLEALLAAGIVDAGRVAAALAAFGRAGPTQ